MWMNDRCDGCGPSVCRSFVVLGLSSLSPAQKPQSCLVRPRPHSLSTDSTSTLQSPLSPLVGVVLVSVLSTCIGLE